MASIPLHLPTISPAHLAWTGAAAGGAGAALAFAQAQTGAGALALVAASACVLLARRVRAPTPQPAAVRPEPRPNGLGDLAPLMEAMPDAVLLVDGDGRVVASNLAARRKFEFEAAGLRLSSLLRQPDLLDAAKAAAHEGAPRTVEFETLGQVDEQVRCYVAPVQWGAARAALIAFHDETARVSTERMRADFLANASHELRTPLAALMVLIETLAGHARDDPEAQMRFLAMMQTQADRMRRLIDDLLSLSRIELDEHVPPSERADLVDVAREAVDALFTVAAARQVRLAIADEGPAVVIGHRFQLVQVAQNLIDNAIKYSPVGGAVTIEIGVADGREEALERAGRRWPEAGRIAMLTPPPATGERRYAYIRVTDSGPGVARRFLPRLGARFFRVEREMGDERGGTGLGLAIVKHIVNRHRGGLLVESEPGRGSAFAAYIESAPPADPTL